jgi:hypothetical protein
MEHPQKKAVVFFVESVAPGQKMYFFRKLSPDQNGIQKRVRMVGHYKQRAAGFKNGLVNHGHFFAKKPDGQFDQFFE